MMNATLERRTAASRRGLASLKASSGIRCACCIAFSALVPNVAAALPWTSLEYQAKKLFLKARVTIEAELVPPERAKEGLLSAPDHTGLMPTAEQAVVSISTQTKFLERTSDITTLLQAPALSGLQRHLLETGSRNRFKTYRFGATAVRASRGEPADAHEATLPPDQWTSRSTELIELGSARGATDPIALLVAASTRPLDELRDGISFSVFSGNEVQQVELVATGAEQKTVDYAIRGAHPLIAPRVLHVLEIRAVTDGAEEFEMLGLEGNLIVRVDSEHRVPVEIEGKMPVLGTVVIRLRQATLTTLPESSD